MALAFRCTRCGARPNVRIFPQTRERYADVDPNEPVKTWACRCGETHVITARAYREAKSPEAA